jgi:hypothetical protein
MNDVLGLWLHSHEEDTGSTKVYRPADHPFPPSRGRDGVELLPDGTYLEYGSGPDDRGSAVEGRWEESGSSSMAATVTRADGSTSTRRISSGAEGVLIVE